MYGVNASAVDTFPFTHHLLPPRGPSIAQISHSGGVTPLLMLIPPPHPPDFPTLPLAAASSARAELALAPPKP